MIIYLGSKFTDLCMTFNMIRCFGYSNQLHKFSIEVMFLQKTITRNDEYISFCNYYLSMSVLQFEFLEKKDHRRA